MVPTQNKFTQQDIVAGIVVTVPFNSHNNPSTQAELIF